MSKTASYVERIVKFPSDPGSLEPGVIYTFVEDGVPQMVDFLCPCGCGNTCPTHLVTPDRPKKPNDRRWEFSRGDAGVTLSPSIRWLSGCKAHFNITNGAVVWHGDSGK